MNRVNQELDEFRPSNAKFERILDVSTLEPCEPLQRILEALRGLKQGEYLHVLHRMEPLPLYRILTQQGFAWRLKKGEKTPVELFIWQMPDPDRESPKIT